MVKVIDSNKEPLEHDGVSTLVSPEIMQGKYCNVAQFKHTANEFVFDFIFQLDGQGILASRVLTSPVHAKLILEALKDNIERYEKAHGKIKVTKDMKKNMQELQ